MISSRRDGLVAGKAGSGPMRRTSFSIRAPLSSREQTDSLRQPRCRDHSPADGLAMQILAIAP